ncbi:hypothetical protein CCACVL1_07996 [Corchorus capsularis]|uniref:Uncharacterized protein n=1 Tax=Corchorus capsularis TaxID=210143 RepID=A0A1R3J2W2_COCAP|nr:hypothetical protein CCACVL1_07996 [Corchorus capsularis]
MAGASIDSEVSEPNLHLESFLAHNQICFKCDKGSLKSHEAKTP